MKRILAKKEKTAITFAIVWLNFSAVAFFVSGLPFERGWYQFAFYIVTIGFGSLVTIGILE